MKQNKLFFNVGIKNTKQRNLVYDILHQSSQPITAEEIFLKYQELDEAISLSTIYRILDLFSTKGLIIKTYINENTKACFIINHHDHKHYLICKNCKKVVEIDGCPFTTYEKELEEKTSFTIQGHKLELFGLCGGCKDSLL
ncbi:MAG: Transcriptional repressor [Haloplasmataceae bacterium]|jgi:Fur family ferric uptake transcriptional regulator|nr:Transcriptional repressor [Haloplasmataceae bacterium]